MKRALAALLVVTSCASPPKGPPEDQALARLGHAGDIAFNLEKPGQAAEQYQSALDRARVRDDPSAIADAGFNLAVAQLRAGDTARAQQTAADLQAELARRGFTDPAFGLITATALYRQNDPVAADGAAAGLTNEKDPALANAAWFLRGLIADQRGDQAALQRALASLTPSADPADHAELQARLDRDAGQALHAADLRRNELDYRGMARTLALAAQFTPNPATAADLYLRAGRIAAAQDDTAQARSWLGLAMGESVDPLLRRDAEQALRKLPGHS
jgi:hypothetical protein